MKPKVYMYPHEVRPSTPEEVAWSGIKQPTLRLVKHPVEFFYGVKVTKHELPEELYHVTTHLSDVLRSKMLVAQATMKAGGLGGGGIPGVSFTKSFDDAKLIARELKRVVKISKGMVNEDIIKEWVKEDEKIANLPEGSLMPAFKEMMVNVNFEKEKYCYYHAYKIYLMARENRGGPIDPIIMGSPKHFKDINLDDIAIIAFKSVCLPDEPLIVDKSSGDFLHEVQVKGDVELKEGCYRVIKPIDEGDELYD